MRPSLKVTTRKRKPQKGRKVRKQAPCTIKCLPDKIVHKPPLPCTTAFASPEQAAKAAAFVPRLCFSTEQPEDEPPAHRLEDLSEEDFDGGAASDDSDVVRMQEQLAEQKK